MTAGDYLQERAGCIGIAYEGTQKTAETTPVYTFACQGNIETVPVLYERENAISAEALPPVNAGYETKFSFSGLEASAEELGYLLWLMFGAATTVTSLHTITPQFNSQYFSFLKDFGGVVDATFPTQVAPGCRLDNLTIEQSSKSFAKVSGSGKALATVEMAAAMSPALDLTDDGRPLGWTDLQSGSGWFKTGYAGAAVAAMPDCSGFKISIARELEDPSNKVSTNQPTEVLEGGRTITFEQTFDLTEDDDDVDSLLDCMKAGSALELDIKWLVDTNYARCLIPSAQVTNSIFGPVGTGNKPQVVTVQAKAYQNATDGPISWEIEDSNTTAYASR